MAQNTLEGVEALIFDLMGTCTDWHTSILTAMQHYPLPAPLSSSDLPIIASQWREGFFEAIFASFEAGEESPNIDVVHAQVLERLLDSRGVGIDVWTDAVRRELVQAWHKQLAWPDSDEGIRQLKGKYIVVVLANGTTRLQLDIIRSSGLSFHTLFSSEILEATKPSPEIYLKALNLLGFLPAQTAMVAAHAYDLRAAATLGMKTIYIQRTTEDLAENMEAVHSDVDLFIDGRGPMGGLLELASLLP